jgi:hypothetical protein
MELNEILKGDAVAIAFIDSIRSIAHAWDDIIDRDHPQDDNAINAAFAEALVILPRNPFYAAHFQVLSPLVMSSILSWIGATRMERDNGTEHDLRVALVTRAQYVQLVLVSAMLLGGFEYASSIASDILRWGHSETFDEYVTALKRERG